MMGGNAYGKDKGCQCVPDFLMSLMKAGMELLGQSGMTGRSLLDAENRAMTKLKIKFGKRQCSCQYDINKNNCKASKFSCDKKCNGAAKNLKIGSYTFNLSSKKGKVSVSSCKAPPPTTEAPSGSAPTGTGPTGSGSGMPGMMQHCACVAKQSGGSGPTGSGSGPTGSGSGPTGSGSGPTGSGSGPTGSGSGSGPTGSGSGSGAPTSSDCKCGLAKRATRIVGGVQAEINEYPWQIGIVSKGSSSVWCGGSLISNRWILTAAHCTKGESASGLQV